MSWRTFVVVAGLAAGCGGKKKAEPQASAAPTPVLTATPSPSAPVVTATPAPSPAPTAAAPVVDPASVPVSISKLTAKAAHMYGDNYYVSVGFNAKALQKIPENAVIKARAECVVGSDILVDDMMALGVDLDKLEPGESQKADASPFAGSSLDVAPATCRITLTFGELFGKQEPVVLATGCLQDGKFSEGACALPAVAAAPAGAPLVSITSIKGAVAEAMEPGFALKIAFIARSNQKQGPATLIRIKAKCKLGTEVFVDEAMAAAELETLPPGFSKKADAMPFMLKALETKPEHCTLLFSAGSLLDEASVKSIATYCLSGTNTIADGACPGM